MSFAVTNSVALLEVSACIIQLHALFIGLPGRDTPPDAGNGACFHAILAANAGMGETLATNPATKWSAADDDNR